MNEPYELRVVAEPGKIYINHYADKDEAIKEAVRIHCELQLNVLVCDLRDMSCVLHLEGIKV